eukprot:633642-Pleurochrysis_carterae.AAC.1
MRRRTAWHQHTHAHAHVHSFARGFPRICVHTGKILAPTHSSYARTRPLTHSCSYSLGTSQSQRSRALTHASARARARERTPRTCVHARLVGCTSHLRKPCMNR